MTYASPPFKSPLRNFGEVDMFIDVAERGGGGGGGGGVAGAGALLLWPELWTWVRTSHANYFYSCIVFIAGLSLSH